MRIVILCSSLYSETSCAMALRLTQLGHPPVGALTLPTLDRPTLLRKLGQWGIRDFARLVSAKLTPTRAGKPRYLRNPHLEPMLRRERGVFLNLREIAAHCGFPIATCTDQNSAASVAQLKQWSPDLIVFTGGNILQKQLIEIPSLGVLNLHLGLLPKIRGMSSPEWSLLRGVPVGITIHYIDEGIDTGPILRTCEFPDVSQCESLSALRNGLIAFGIEKVGEVVLDLHRGAILATTQSEGDRDNQFFVMHEWLQSRASERLKKQRSAAMAGKSDG
jgi:folate-dependent phosphoribosylglycinamide formyltransferase PurN